MKILVVSDVVVPELFPEPDPDYVRGTDLMLSCGDLPPEYLTFLVARFDLPLYYVRGNHDIRYESRPPDGGMNLDQRLIQFGGLNFLGLEGSRWYNGGPCQYTERQMRKRIRSLRPGIWWQGGLDVIVTHAPPRYVHDAEDLCHRGFKSFNWLIQKYRPKLFIHGHIHQSFTDPSQRITRINQTQVINAYGHVFVEIET